MRLRFIRMLTFICIAILIFAFSNSVKAATTQQTNGGMPEWPQPANPIPRHEPGYRAKFSNGSVYNQVNTSSIQDTMSMDAMLQNGLMDHPFEGNPTFAEHEQIMFGWLEPADDGTTSTLKTQASSASMDVGGDEMYELATASVITDSLAQFGPVAADSTFAIIARDINFDGQDEQISAWKNAQQKNQIFVSIGQMAGTSGKVKGSPAIVQTNQGTELFVRGFDDSLWHRVVDSEAEWTTLGGVLAASPTAVSLPGTNNIQVFALGTDGAIYATKRNDTEWTGSWEQISETTGQTFQSAPSAVVNGGSTMVLARALDNTVWYCTFDGINCTEWQSVAGGFVTSDLQVVGHSGMPLALFAQGFDNGLWYSAFSEDQWSDWQQLELPDGLSLIAAPAAISSGSSTIEIYALASDWSIRHAQYTIGDSATWRTLVDSAALSAPDAPMVTDLSVASPSLLYSRFANGQLSRWQTTADNWPGEPIQELPACCTTIETGIVPLSLDTKVVVDTGYFTNSEHPQIVVSTLNITSEIEIHIYDVSSNGQSRLISQGLISDSLNTAPAFHIATGNYINPRNGSILGQDEIAIGYSRSSDFAVQIWSLDDNMQFIKSAETTFGSRDYVDSFYPNPEKESCFKTRELHLLSVVNHDIRISTAQFTDSGADSIAIGFSTTLEFGRDFGFPCDWRYRTHYAAFTLGLHTNSMSDTMISSNPQWVNLANNTQPLFSFAVGDITGPTSGIARADEIVGAYPDGTLRVYALGSDMSITEIASASSALENVRVDVGDLNRDLKDEIVLFADATTPTVSIYQYQEDKLSLVDNYPLDDLPATSTHRVLTMGSFTGETLRVGTPTHRVETEVVDTIAILNHPPTHRDFLSIDLCDASGECDLNSQNAGTYAAFKEAGLDSDNLSISVKRAWNTGGNEDFDILFRKSATSTYGESFEKVTQEIEEIEFRREIKTNKDDIGIYTILDYDIWEYPLYSDAMGHPISYVIAIFPKPSTNSSNITLPVDKIQQGRTCNSWYNAMHAPHNVWSYADTTSQLIGYTDDRRLLQANFDAGIEQSVELTLNSVNASKLVSSLTKNFENAKGWGFDLRLFKFGIGWGKSKVEGNYEGTLTTHTIKANESTSLMLNFAPLLDPQRLAKQYEFDTYIYWTDDGYLMLDYTTKPGGGRFWQAYDKPDPAFTYFWFDEDYDCNEEIADKEFSRDIAIEPAGIRPGETVTITATVRNLSNHVANNIKVRFYLGNPQNGGVEIGESTVDTVARSDGRNKYASFQWIPSVYGEHRIYAVVDPDNEIAEVHDEANGRNNNKAYGVVSISAADYVDPGLLLAGQAYYELSLGTQDTVAGSTSSNPIVASPPFEAIPVGSVNASAFIPLDSLDSKVTPFDFTVAQDIQNSRGIVGTPVKLEAYSADGPLDGYTFQESSSKAPNGILRLAYSDGDVSSLEGTESDLRLFRWNGTSWEDPNCGSASHYPEKNQFIASICATGAFAIVDTTVMGTAEPSLDPSVYLPLLQ